MLQDAQRTENICHKHTTMQAGKNMVKYILIIYMLA